jgi:hypothetical protein
MPISRTTSSGLSSSSPSSLSAFGQRSFLTGGKRTFCGRHRKNLEPSLPVRGLFRRSLLFDERRTPSSANIHAQIIPGYLRPLTFVVTRGPSSGWVGRWPCERRAIRTGCLINSRAVRDSNSRPPDSWFLGASSAWLAQSSKRNQVEGAPSRLKRAFCSSLSEL